MPDGSSLIVDVALSTAKLERDADRIVQKMTRSGQQIDSAWLNATQGIDNGFKKAGASAAVFEREIAKTDRQVENLRKSVDPLYAATQRLERQEKLLSRALRQGNIDAKAYEATLSLVRAEFDLASAGARRMAGAIAGANGAARFGGGQIQNVAFQVGDFATQVGAGTSASIALGQQLPQLLGGFGALGAVLGAVTAIGVPLISSFVRSGDASSALSDTTQTLTQAVNDYTSAAQAAGIPTEELAEKYGTASEAAQAFLLALADLDRVDAIDAVSASLDGVRQAFGASGETLGLSIAEAYRELDELTIRLADVREEAERTTDFALAIDLEAQADAIAQNIVAVEDYIGSVRDLIVDFNLGVTEAQALASALDALGAADGVEAQAEAARDLQAVMLDVFGSVEDMDASLRDVFRTLVTVGEAAAEVQGAVEGSVDASQDLVASLFQASDGLAAASGNASVLLGNLQAAAVAAFELARAQAAAQQAAGAARGPDGAVEDVRNRQAIDPDTIVSQISIRARTPRSTGGSSARGSSGTGGASGASGPTLPPLFEDIEGQLQGLERQITLIGRTDQEVAELTATYELMDAARERGLDLDAQAAGSNRTLREEIESQARAYANLTEQLRSGEATYDAFQSGIASISDEIANAVVNFESLGDVFRGVIRQMAADLISSGIQSLLTQTFAPLLLGGLGIGAGAAVPTFDGGGFTGAGSRTGGVDGRGGFPAILHPNETVIDHTRGGGSASAPVTVVNNFDMSGAVGVDGVQAMLSAYDQQLQSNLPGIIKTAVSSPRMVRA